MAGRDYLFTCASFILFQVIFVCVTCLFPSVFISGVSGESVRACVCVYVCRSEGDLG